jgi:hypothetical protein
MPNNWLSCNRNTKTTPGGISGKQLTVKEKIEVGLQEEQKFCCKIFKNEYAFSELKTTFRGQCA